MNAEWPADSSPIDTASQPAGTIWSGTLGAAWLPGHGDTGLGVTSVQATYGCAVPWSDSGRYLLVSPGGGIHRWENSALALPSSVYDLFVDISCDVVQSDSWGIVVSVAPGWYGDFEDWGGATFQLTGFLLTHYHLGPKWTLSGGLAYVRQLQSSWLPVGGVIWRPTEDWRLEVLVPRPRLYRRVIWDGEQEVWAYFGGQYGGGSWAVDDGIGGQSRVTLSDLRCVVGIDWQSTSSTRWNFETGYVFERDLAIDDSVVFSPSATWLFQIRLDF